MRGFLTMPLTESKRKMMFPWKMDHTCSVIDVSVPILFLGVNINIKKGPLAATLLILFQQFQAESNLDKKVRQVTQVRFYFL